MLTRFVYDGCRIIEGHPLIYEEFTDESLSYKRIYCACHGLAAATPIQYDQPYRVNRDPQDKIISLDYLDHDENGLRYTVARKVVLPNNYVTPSDTIPLGGNTISENTTLGVNTPNRSKKELKKLLTKNGLKIYKATGKYNETMFKTYKAKH